MNEVEIIKTGGNKPETPKKNIDLDTFKSLHYWMNAKPDSQIKFFRKRKRLELADIYALNERVVKKLEIHNVLTYSVSLNFILDEGNVKEYSTWAEFERENWEFINQKVLSVNLSWDLTFDLNGYEFPQRHTMKLRMGNAIAPKDMFQMMFTSDEPSELMEVQAEGLVKVDFINQVLANELIAVVSNWNEGLSEINSVSGVIKFLTRRESYINTFIAYVIPLFFLYCFYTYQKILCKEFDFSADLDILILQQTLIFFLALYAIGNILAKYVNRWLNRKLEKLKFESGILISNGDKKFLEQMSVDNNKQLKEIALKFGIPLIVGIILIFIRIPIESWLK